MWSVGATAKVSTSLLCLDISPVCLFVFSKQTQNKVNKSKVSNGTTQSEAPSAFKGNQRINSTIVFSFQLQFQVIVCNLRSFKRGAEEGSDCWLCRNRMFQWLISCLSRLAFFVSVFSRHSRVALLFPHLSWRCHNRSQKTHFTISAEIKCSRLGKLYIPPRKKKRLSRNAGCLR